MDIPLVVAGDDSFVGGCDSYTQPGKLMPGEYVISMNTVNRGGLIQTRPGSKSNFDMPSGNVQGCRFFTPASGVPHLVFAVSGYVYVSPSPFRFYHLLPDIKFNPSSRFVTWADCIQSTDYTADGIFYALDRPKPVLVMQDGVTRAAYWDGASAGHIDPTPSHQELTLPGKDGTPIGLWSAWSNNRLWVTRGSQVFASDIGNPLKFTEGQYLNEGRSFYLTGDCTGIAETADRQGILCFTSSTGTLFQSAIQDRTLWLSTAGFQQTVLPGIGCVSPRSIVQQYGLLWWFTSKGLISQNSALNLNITSRLDIQDNELFQSKYNLSYDLSGVCGSYFENFLFHAVPNGDKLNTRLHVLDQAPFESSVNSWPSYWTGWRPIEFARGIINSKERVFFCSTDYDGVNRMWELFQPEKTDNGIPITSFVATKQHFFDNRDYKKFRYAEVELQAISGPTAVMVAAAGTRGAFQKILDKDINSTNGQIYANYQYGYHENLINGSSSQSRIIRSIDSASASVCNSECVEGPILGLIDKAFSLLIVWSGIAGVSAYRIFVQGEPTAYIGTCEDNETEEDRLLSPEGCGIRGLFLDANAFEAFLATATFQRINPATGLVVSKTFTQDSVINLSDAERKAAQTARWYVLSQIGEII